LRIDRHSDWSAIHTAAQNLPGAKPIEGFVEIIIRRDSGARGLELQSNLNAAGFRIPIIFISAHDDGEAKSRALKASAVDFLKKPFSEDALLSALRACLRVEGDTTNDPGRDESF
jgi:FixJ family two-component response regulator